MAEEESKESAGEKLDKPVSSESIAELEDALEKKRDEARDYLRQLQRLQADFENYRRRMMKEQKRWAVDARAEVLQALFPVLDNLERALENEEGGEQALRDGLSMTLNQFLGIMREQGVERIAAEGKRFDPEFHEAMFQQETEQHPHNAVIEELQAGYAYKGRVLRPTRVKVAKNPQSAEDDESGEKNEKSAEAVNMIEEATEEGEGDG